MGIFSKPDTHSVLLVDIASASVGVGLSGVREQALPELVVTTRVPFAHKPDFDFVRIEHAMLLALRDALGVAFREGTLLLSKKGYPSSINHCIISFSSPWFVSKLGNSQSDFVSDLMGRYESDMELFASDQGLHSATQVRLLRQIEDEIIRAFGIKEGVSPQNFTVMFSKVVDHAFQDIEPALFVDMTGHTTDILSMNKGAFHTHHSMPLGTLGLKEKQLEWNAFWNELSKERSEEFSSGNVFLISDDYPGSKDLLGSLLPKARIIPFGSENGFIREMVKFDGTALPNERLAILLTFSNLFL
ncbi:MAG: hypothetical protein JWN50_262 [Parcubacteria group bacterium]|nr:hypothetical protein [Parcubacteria group bacterium]